MRLRFATFLLMCSAMLLAMPALAAGKRAQANALNKAQYEYSAAIRWGDIEGAWEFVDPAAKNARPMTDLERNRYKQIKVTSYRPVSGGMTPDGGAERLVEVGVVNVNTMAERVIRYRELWRWDATAKTWFVAGLPDFWAGR